MSGSTVIAVDRKGLEEKANTSVLIRIIRGISVGVVVALIPVGLICLMRNSLTSVKYFFKFATYKEESDVLFYGLQC